MTAPAPLADRGVAVSPRELQGIGALVAVQFLLVGAYFAVTPSEPSGIRHVLYPLVWITAGVWSVHRAGTPSADRRARIVAGGIAATYLLVLAWIAGLASLHLSGAPPGGAGLRIVDAAPGRGPAAIYTGTTVRIVLVPYLVVGYLALAYLVYAALLDAAGAALSGVLGLAACVSCSAPVVASLVAGVAGGSSGLTTAAYSFSPDLSTAAFLLAVVLLLWRPGWG